MAERYGEDDLTNEKEFGTMSSALGIIAGIMLVGVLLFFFGGRLREVKAPQTPDIEFIRPTKNI